MAPPVRAGSGPALFLRPAVEIGDGRFLAHLDEVMQPIVEAMLKAP